MNCSFCRKPIADDRPVSCIPCYEGMEEGHVCDHDDCGEFTKADVATMVRDWAKRELLLGRFSVDDVVRFEDFADGLEK